MDASVSTALNTFLGSWQEALLAQLATLVPIAGAVLIGTGVVFFAINMARRFFFH